MFVFVCQVKCEKKLIIPSWSQDMDLIEEQIKAYENMIVYLQKQISRLKRKVRDRDNASRDCDGKIFSDECCMEVIEDNRIRLPIAFRGS